MQKKLTVKWSYPKWFVILQIVLLASLLLVTYGYSLFLEARLVGIEYKDTLAEKIEEAYHLVDKGVDQATHEGMIGEKVRTMLTTVVDAHVEDSIEIYQRTLESVSIWTDRLKVVRDIVFYLYLANLLISLVWYVRNKTKTKNLTDVQA